MTEKALTDQLKHTVKTGARNHVEALKVEHPDLYGYALLPGEPYEVTSLVAVWNRESELKEKDSPYFRYAVDEWAHWDHDALVSATPLIAELNRRFRSLHPGDPTRYEMDESEIQHVARIHQTLLDALGELLHEGVFNLGPTQPFLAIWISDSEHEIIFRSVAELNQREVVRQFQEEFAQ